MVELRKHQIDAINGINKAFEENDKCLAKLFCACGKSRIAFSKILDVDFSVLVFPSIALVTQFNRDYLLNPKWEDLTDKYKIMSICSKDELKDDLEHNVIYTTDNDKISKFLEKQEKQEKQIITVTYQSLQTFITSLKEVSVLVELMIFDEAHHIIGNKCQKIVFDKYLSNYVDKMLFLTATPKNDNGIIMLDRDNPENSNCGPLAFEYTHMDAINEEVPICKDFEICIDLYTKDTKDNLYQAIARSSYNTDNYKILTFHSMSEGERDKRTNVSQFVKEKDKIIEEFNNVKENEFPDKEDKKVIIKGITASTKDRENIRFI